MDMIAERTLLATAAGDASPRDCGISLQGTAPRHVQFGGWVRRPFEIDAEELARMNPVEIDDFVVICTLDGAHGGARPMRAVPLAALIERAQPAFKERTDFKRVAIVAESQDGYRALFSWNEIFNSVIGDGVFLAFHTAAAPLSANDGPFALVSRYDRFTGPRYVRGLRSVELHKLW